MLVAPKMCEYFTSYDELYNLSYLRSWGLIIFRDDIVIYYTSSEKQAEISSSQVVKLVLLLFSSNNIIKHGIKGFSNFVHRPDSKN
jgi:hypothetical protein